MIVEENNESRNQPLAKSREKSIAPAQQMPVSLSKEKTSKDPRKIETEATLNQLVQLKSKRSKIMNRVIKQNPDLSKELMDSKKSIRRIDTQLQVKVWVWDKNAGHKLFNFHDGFEILPTGDPIVGSYIASKMNSNNVVFNKAREMHNVPISHHLSHAEKKKQVDAERKKLLNIAYNDGTYYIHEPQLGRALRRDPDIIIDKQCWLILKFLPQMQTQVKLNDTLRFGRVSFKVTELVLTKSQIEQSKATLEQLKKGVFQMQAPTQIANDRHSIHQTMQSAADLTELQRNDSMMNVTLQNNQLSQHESATNLLGGPASKDQSAIFNGSLLVRRHTISQPDLLLNESQSGLTILTQANNAAGTTLQADRKVDALNLSMQPSQTLVTQANDGGQGAGNSMLDPINLALNKNEGESHGLRGPLVQTGAHISSNGVLGDIRLQSDESDAKVCRICLDEEEDLQSGNPFITPCKCMGSMKYIHLKCLREWTDSKKQFQQEEGITSYYWGNLTCELCKAELDLVIRSATDPGKAIFVLDLDRPVDQPYMVIESDIDCAAKAVHIMNFGIQDYYTIGRRANNDISVSDISVSRKQASIQFKDEKVYLTDLDSKFGTFKQIQGLLPVTNNDTVPVQIEKKCFFFQLEDRLSSFEKLCNLCCNKKQAHKDIATYDYLIYEFQKFPQATRDQLLPTLDIAWKKIKEEFRKDLQTQYDDIMKSHDTSKNKKDGDGQEGLKASVSDQNFNRSSQIAPAPFPSLIISDSINPNSSILLPSQDRNMKPLQVQSATRMNLNEESVSGFMDNNGSLEIEEEQKGKGGVVETTAVNGQRQLLDHIEQSAFDDCQSVEKGSLGPFVNTLTHQPLDNDGKLLLKQGQRNNNMQMVTPAFMNMQLSQDSQEESKQATRALVNETSINETINPYVDNHEPRYLNQDMSINENVVSQRNTSTMASPAAAQISKDLFKTSIFRRPKFTLAHEDMQAFSSMNETGTLVKEFVVQDNMSEEIKSGQVRVDDLEKDVDRYQNEAMPFGYTQANQPNDSLVNTSNIAAANDELINSVAINNPEFLDTQYTISKALEEKTENNQLQQSQQQSALEELSPDKADKVTLNKNLQRRSLIKIQFQQSMEIASSQDRSNQKQVLIPKLQRSSHDFGTDSPNMITNGNSSAVMREGTNPQVLERNNSDSGIREKDFVMDDTANQNKSNLDR